MSEYEADLPKGWKRVNHLCNPANGRKVFKNLQGKTVHISPHPRGRRYLIEEDSADGEVTHHDTKHNYMAAKHRAEQLMENINNER